MTPRSARASGLARHSLQVLLVAALALGTRAWAGFPSPADWRDQVVYQIVTDRFANGDAANDAVEGNYDPANGSRIHGGDFRGLEQKLDYLQTLGVTAVWISPVPLNAYAEYHGYAARDFKAIAPHFGSLADLQSLVAAAHARGIYVILDVVCNHTGDLIGSRTAGYPTYQNPSSYVLEYWNASRKQAAPFNNLSWYHNNGNIGNFNDPEQIVGELFGLDDLKTELPAVRTALVDAFTWLIQMTDCDGFRVDTVKHTELSFWQDWLPQVRAFAATQGKSDFLFFGEVFDGSDFKNGIYTGTQAGGAYAFDSMLYYPMYYTTNDVFVSGAATSSISNRYAQLGFYDPTVRQRLVRFLDNHDNPRFLSSNFAAGDAARLKTALVFHLTSQGIPCVYYGTEQGFDGGQDPADREDMFDGAWEFGPSLGDDFDESSSLFGHTQTLLELRRLYPALRRGSQVERLSVGSSGIYAYSRLDGGQEVLVVLNTATSPRTANNLLTTWASGTSVANLLDPAQTWAVEPAGTVDVTLGARGYAILTRAADVLARRPVVTGTFPVHDGTLAWRDGPLRIAFSKPMHHASVEPRLHITPDVAGSVRWSGNTLEFRPAAAWTAGTLYRVEIEAGAHDTLSPPLALPARFEMQFRVSSAATRIQVSEAGFESEIWSVTGFSTPEGIEFADGAFGDFCYVGDEGLDLVLGLDATGAALPRTTTGTLTKPEGLVWDAASTYGGGILIADQNGVFKMSAAGTLTSFLGASSESQTGWIGIDPNNAFGGRLHLGSNSANEIRSYTSAGTASTLATGIHGFEAAAFGPGGAWGTDLYVADPDLTAFFSGIDGTGSILRVTPAGAKTTFAGAGALTQGLAALAFDTTGAFGGDLFAADVALERIVRITPTGQVSVFASGFGNLFSSDCLAFGPDGHLYVVDTGSGQPFTDTSGGTAAPRIVRFRPSIASDTTPPMAHRVRLLPNVPNPFNPGTVLYFEAPEGQSVQLDIVDVRGRWVRRLTEERAGVGVQSVYWDGLDAARRSVASGVYVVQLRSQDATTSRRITLLR